MSLKRASKKPDPNRYPAGMDARKVKSLIAHYEGQSDEAAIAEAEAAYHRQKTTMIEVPSRLLPKIRMLIGKAG